MQTCIPRSFVKTTAFLLSSLLAIQAATGAEEDVIVLTPFEVTALSEQIYGSTQTNTGTIVAKPRDQIPFVTSVLTGAVIEDLRLQNPSEFAMQFAGVGTGPQDQFLNDGAQLGSGTSYTIRGFSTEPLYNGFQTGALNISTDGVGRVEVTKGANSILYGQSSAGGTINIVPKDAVRQGSLTALTVGVSSDDGYRGTFETGGVVAGKSDTGFRIGGGYQEHTRTEWFYWNNQTSLYGAYRTNLADKVTVEIQADGVTTKTHPARTAAFVSTGSGTARVTDPNNRVRNDRNFNYHGPWSYREGDAGVVSGYLTAQLSPNWTLRLGALRSQQHENADSVDGVYGLSVGPTATGYYQDTTRERSVAGYKADLLHQAEFRNFKFDSIIGFESHRSRDRSIQLRTVPAVTPITVTIPLGRDGVEADWPRPPAPSLYTNLSNNVENKLWWTNVRFTQFISAPDSRATVMWGVAQGEGQNTTRDRRTNSKAVAVGDDTTYTVGGTYLLRETDEAKWTAFANTSTSFLIQAGNRQNPADFNGFPTVAALRAFVDSVNPNAIDPQIGEGIEAGIRYARKDGKLRIEILGFQQERGNISRNFFVRESNVVGIPSEQLIATFQLASGTEESKGVEMSFNWNPSKEFGVFASGMLSNGKVTSNPEAPEEVGFQLVNSPENMFNFWMRYAPASGIAKGFVFGAGATYRNETRVFPNLNDRYRITDAYTFGRAMVAYEFATGERKHRISVNIDNLLDEEYVSENGHLSQPLITRLTYSLKW